MTHGDIFDSITSNLRWIAYLGDMGYTFLLWLNRVLNHYRYRRGLPYFSLSQYVKNKVKSAVSYIDQYETELAKMARSKNCDGIICGHIHKAEKRLIDGVEYLNSGDWVESLSALSEDHDGNWQLIYYNEVDFKQNTGPKIESYFQGIIPPHDHPLREVSFEARKDDLDPPFIR